MPIGTKRKRDLPPNLNIKVVKELTVLGVKVSTNINEIVDNNIESKMPAIYRDLEQWKRRNLTPIGKICIIKTLLLSKLVHLFIALPNPSMQRLKDIETMLFDFLWSGRGDKIKRTKLMQTYENDGLNMIDIKSFIYSLKLSWLKRLIQSKADWTFIANTQIPSVNNLLTYGKEKLTQLRAKITNSFYMDVINALIMFNTYHEPNNDEILTETIWFSAYSGFPTSIVKNGTHKAYDSYVIYLIP